MLDITNLSQFQIGDLHVRIGNLSSVRINVVYKCYCFVDVVATQSECICDHVGFRGLFFAHCSFPKKIVMGLATTD